MVKISIYNLVGGSAAISSDDGKTVYNMVDAILTQGKTVTLDFINIEIVTAVFLNNSVGQLYRKYRYEYLNEYLVLKNLTKDDEKLVTQVIERIDYPKVKQQQVEVRPVMQVKYREIIPNMEPGVCGCTEYFMGFRMGCTEKPCPHGRNWSHVKLEE